MNKGITAGSYTQIYTAANANNGNQADYWEGAANTYPNWLRVDLGGVSSLNKVVLKLPTNWGSRTQTLSVQASLDDASYSTIVNSATYTFSPSANTVTITFASVNARYVKLNFTANSGATGGQLSEFEVYGGAVSTPTPTPTPTPTTTPSPTPTPTSGTRSAFVQTAGSEYDSMSGIQLEASSEGGQNIAFIDNGDYIQFNHVDFGSGASSVNLRVASNSSGGNIEVRLDSLNGTLAGTCAVPVTGGWQNWVTQSCGLNTVSGVHSLYLKFTGGSGALFNVNWFKFISVSATPTPPGFPQPGRHTKIVSTNYPTTDVVIADYDVIGYGADNTGVSDSTSAINAAMNDCYSNGGGTVWLPDGTYKVTSTINVYAYCTLRGDWHDPDNGAGAYGTTIRAEVASGDSGPVVFQIGGSAGVKGVTVYYPNQNASNPVPYNSTLLIPGGDWIGSQNFMMSTIENVTLLNSYRGIGISVKPGDVGAGGHEVAQVKNIRATALYRGAVAYNGSDVGTWQHVKFSNSYWANAGASFNAPALTTLNSYTRANGIAFTIGELEWDQFQDIYASDYNIGMNIVKGPRGEFSGVLWGATLINTNVAVKVDAIDTRWGAAFLRSTLAGSSYSVQNNSGGYIKVADSSLSGATAGNVQVSNPGSPTSYSEPVVPKVTRAVLYDVSQSPYNAPSVSSRGPSLPTVDATSSIQSALNDAGNAGGGVVYVPAGWYKISTHLTIPANVELRGASSVPQRDEDGYSAGTVLMAYEGHNTSNPETATALLTLNGNRAGVSGLRVFYPNNNPANGVVPYPYMIRGNGSSTYVVNIGTANAYNAVDLSTYRNDNHYVHRVVGLFLNNGIVVGNSTTGWIDNVLTNGNAITRIGYNVPGWVSGSNLFSQVIDPVTRQNEKLIVINGASNEWVSNAFAYGANLGLYVKSGTVNAVNLGTDNLGTGGYTVKVDSGTAKVMNMMRYNGTTSTGPVTIYNEMHL
uniref:Carbohydrate-binding protein n=1 Tax=Paenibacillus athensensis TaxID=1967502 RepID=A0A4Y8PQD0_9BACL